MSQLKKLPRRVDVESVDEYFSLPRRERERWGFWYLLPNSLPCKGFLFDDNDGGWGEFEVRIRNVYPVQNFLRKDLGFYIGSLGRSISRAYYGLKCVFFPHHKIIRRSIPRRFSDITELIIDVNFAMIRDFYHNEVVDGPVDWFSDEQHTTFHSWLTQAVYYIEERRPELQRLLRQAYPSHDRIRRGLPYEELYGDVDLYEKIIEVRDRQILHKMIDYREMFWT